MSAIKLLDDLQDKDAYEKYGIDVVESGSESGSEYDDVDIQLPHVYSGLMLTSRRNNQYLLLKQIGFGSNAVVWIAYCITSADYVAVKVQDEKCVADGIREVNLLNEIKTYITAHPDTQTNCVVMTDYLPYVERDGKEYICSVYELCADSCISLLVTGVHKYGFPVEVVKSIARQILQALVFLHDEMHIIHTDVKPHNILIRGKSGYTQRVIDLFEASGFKEKYARLGQVITDDAELLAQEIRQLALESVTAIRELKVCEALEELDEDVESGENFCSDDIADFEEDFDDDGEADEEEQQERVNKRSQSVDDFKKFMEFKDICDVEQYYEFLPDLNLRVLGTTTDTRHVIDEAYVTNCQVLLTDFGSAYHFAKRTRSEIQDRTYRAPEVVLNLNYGYGVDIWGLCCTVFELLTGYALFKPEDIDLTRDIHQLFLMEKQLGPMPIKMRQASNRRQFLFDADRNWAIKNVDKIQPVPIAWRLQHQFLYDAKTAAEISDFLMKGLRYNPKSRPTARELLQHPWLAQTQ